MKIWFDYLAALLKNSLILIAVLGWLPLAFAANSPDSCQALLDEKSDLSKLQRIPLLFTWKQFALDWKASVTKTLHESAGPRPPGLPAYRLAVESNDIRIESFKQFGFDFSNLATNTIGVPDFDEVVAVYLARLKEGIERGRFDPKHKMVPGVLVKDAAGKLFALPYGEEREGVYHVDVTGEPHLFTKLLRAGVFAVTSNRRALHDFYHLKGFSEDLSYMAGIHALAENFGVHGHRLPLRDRYVRFFSAHEAFCYLPEAKREKLTELLSPVFADGTKSPTVLLVFHDLFAQEKAGLLEGARKLMLFAAREVVFLGGASEIGISYTDVELQDSLPILIRNVRRALVNLEEASALRDEREIKDRHRFVALHRARLEVALWYSSFLTVDNYFGGIIATKLDATSPLYAMQVASGLGSSGYRLPDKSAQSLISLSLNAALTEDHEVNFGEQYRSAFR